MHFLKRTTLIALGLLMTAGAAAQKTNDDSEQLKIAALEALISAPAERALPIVSKVLNGDFSNDLKSHSARTAGNPMRSSSMIREYAAGPIRSRHSSSNAR
jgi:hypothetical protein